MKRSEQILLGVLAVVCLVAVAPYFLGEESTRPTIAGTVEQFEQFVTTLRDKVLGSAASEAEQHALELLDSPPAPSPFFAADKAFFFADEEPEEEIVADYVYSGYLRFGGRAMAVINDMEYAVGEELADSGFRVVAIGREFVELERKDMNTGRTTTRRVPIVEDDMQQISLRSSN